MTTPMTNMFHHLTRALVLSAVLRWVRSRTTMYDCSSLTWARRSERRRTIEEMASQYGNSAISLEVLWGGGRGVCVLTFFLERV